MSNERAPMADPLCVHGVTFTAASPAERQRGLLGYISCTIGDSLVLDALTLRRTRDGQLTVSFPARRDGQGRKHSIVRPLNSASRAAIEAQILAAIQLPSQP